jgi:hypothetical protein
MIFLLTASHVPGITGKGHHVQFVDTGGGGFSLTFYRLVSNSNPSVSASQVAGITGMCHHAQLCYTFQNMGMKNVSTKEQGALYAQFNHWCIPVQGESVLTIANQMVFQSTVSIF